MTKYHLLLAMLILYMGLLSSCGKAERQEGVHVADTSAASGISESAGQTDDPVTTYLKKTGSLDGDVYCLNEQLTDDVSARWELSEEEPVLVSCHAVIDEGIDFFFGIILTMM